MSIYKVEITHIKTSKSLKKYQGQKTLKFMEKRNVEINDGNNEKSSCRSYFKKAQVCLLNIKSKRVY